MGRERPPTFPNPIFLGHYRNHDLFTTPEAKMDNCLSNFVLFVLDAAGETASPAASAGGKASRAGLTIQVTPNSTLTPDQLPPATH